MKKNNNIGREITHSVLLSRTPCKMYEKANNWMIQVCQTKENPDKVLQTGSLELLGVEFLMSIVLVTSDGV